MFLPYSLLPPPLPVFSQANTPGARRGSAACVRPDGNDGKFGPFFLKRVCGSSGSQVTPSRFGFVRPNVLKMNVWGSFLLFFLSNIDIFQNSESQILSRNSLFNLKILCFSLKHLTEIPKRLFHSPDFNLSDWTLENAVFYSCCQCEWVTSDFLLSGLWRWKRRRSPCRTDGV